MIQEKQLSDYERGGLIGRGGQASVYQYTYPPTNEVFAVKVLTSHGSDGDGRPLPAKRAEPRLREVLLTPRTDHVRLLHARELCHYADGFALIMPYYERGNLCSVIRNRGFVLVQKREATRQILDGLHHLHELNIFHRDIKPSNTLVQSIKPLSLIISDFGQVSLSDPVTFVGTPLYRAPEIINNLPLKRPHTKAVDIYSVGMLILWLLGHSVLGAHIEHEELWTEDEYDEAIGSKLAVAINRHSVGEIHHPLVMAQAMIRWDSAKRPSAAACLRLQWLRPAGRANVSTGNSKGSGQHTPRNQRTGQPSPRRSSRIAQNSRSAAQHSGITKNADFDGENHDPMDID